MAATGSPTTGPPSKTNAAQLLLPRSPRSSRPLRCFSENGYRPNEQQTREIDSSAHVQRFTRTNIQTAVCALRPSGKRHVAHGRLRAGHGPAGRLLLQCAASAT